MNFLFKNSIPKFDFKNSNIRFQNVIPSAETETPRHVSACPWSKRATNSRECLSRSVSRSVSLIKFQSENILDASYIGINILIRSLSGRMQGGSPWSVAFSEANEFCELCNRAGAAHSLRDLTDENANQNSGISIETSLIAACVHQDITIQPNSTESIAKEGEQNLKLRQNAFNMRVTSEKKRDCHPGRQCCRVPFTTQPVGFAANCRALNLPKLFWLICLQWSPSFLLVSYLSDLERLEVTCQIGPTTGRHWLVFLDDRGNYPH